VYILYVKGVSEKCQCIENRCNIRMTFRTKHILRSLPMKTRPGRRRSVSIAFPVNVAEATVVKQADL
jgi:hypothetical protein